MANKLTLTSVRTQLRQIGVVIKTTEWSEYRVNFRGAGEATAYYTGDLEDARDTGIAMVAQNPGTGAAQ
jgi:hypothetical protein